MSARTVLLTGFPAVRARYVLGQLLASEPFSKLILLVHPERQSEAAELLPRFGARSGRVELWPANPASIDFGLDAESYRRLSREVEVVHAAYTITEGFVGSSLAEQVNLGSTRELVEFSRSAERLRRVVLYSSVFVSGQRTGRIEEAELEAEQSFRNPVEKSLALAERTLRRSAAPWIVLRAGHLLGDTQHGKVDYFAGPYPLIVWVLSAPSNVPLPFPPGSEAPLALTPIEHLARFGMFAASDAPTNTTLHVIDPEMPTLRQLLSAVAVRTERKLEPSFNPSSFTRTLLGNSAARWLPQAARDVLDVLRSNAEYDTKQVEALRARGAPACPPLDGYLDALISDVRERIEHETLPATRRHEAPFLVS